MSAFLAVLVTVLVVLHGVPWWVLVMAPDWPASVTTCATILTVLVAAGFPLAMWRGHGARHRDGLAVAGDTWLGLIWLLFSWSVVGGVADLVLAVSGAPYPDRTRWIAGLTVAWVALLATWGFWQARRVPAVRHLDVGIPRLGAGLDGLRVALLTDTHFGPIDRARWSAGVARAVNGLDADIVAHAGDIADGSVDLRRAQAAPLGTIRAREARVYITGNHEYMSGALEWSTHMGELGWTVLHNSHVLIRRNGSTLALAGVDDRTAAGSGVPGHGADLPTALAGIESDTPVLLLAHQPRQVRESAAAGIDLQLSGHTHGGQIWPFHLIVRAEQGVLHGLSRHGQRTVLYTSRGSGFWGPPFRVFAPSEITLLTLRAGSAEPTPA